MTQKDPLVVGTRSGRISGVREHGHVAFRGIPYAASPTGSRWLGAPEREEAWAGVRPAEAWGATAPQHPHRLEILPEVLRDGPDYLNLNVFTPDIGGGGLPVLVWIHGGSFITGSPGCRWYDASAFAADGVVLVTITYRLGFEGLLPIPGCASNRAVRDWIAALTWVQDCIAAFGGDPGNVTIAGQSAGSEACLTLLSVPAARGLFRRVIAMSGSLLPTSDIADVSDLVQQAATALGVSPDRSGLGSVTPGALLEIQPKVMGANGGGDRKSFVDKLGESSAYLRPIVDGDLVPTLPFDAVVAGAGSDIELLLGCTSEEINCRARIRWITEDGLRRGLANLGLGLEQIDTYLAVHRRKPRREILGQAMTDRIFRASVARLAEARASGSASAATYCYEFGWGTSAFFGILGAAHCIDIPFAFNSLDSAKGRLIKETAPRPLAAHVHHAWSEFVSGGDPGWPRYEAPTRSVMTLDTVSRLDDDPVALARSLWP